MGSSAVISPKTDILHQIIVLAGRYAMIARLSIALNITFPDYKDNPMPTQAEKAMKSCFQLCVKSALLEWTNSGNTCQEDLPHLSLVPGVRRCSIFAKIAGFSVKAATPTNKLKQP